MARKRKPEEKEPAQVEGLAEIGMTLKRVANALEQMVINGSAYQDLIAQGKVELCKTCGCRTRLRSRPCPVCRAEDVHR